MTPDVAKGADSARASISRRGDSRRSRGEPSISFDLSKTFFAPRSVHLRRMSGVA